MDGNLNIKSEYENNDEKPSQGNIVRNPFYKRKAQKNEQENNVHQQQKITKTIVQDIIQQSNNEINKDVQKDIIKINYLINKDVENFMPTRSASRSIPRLNWSLAEDLCIVQGAIKFLRKQKEKEASTTSFYAHDKKMMTLENLQPYKIILQNNQAILARHNNKPRRLKRRLVSLATLEQNARYLRKLCAKNLDKKFKNRQELIENVIDAITASCNPKKFLNQIDKNQQE